jgi:hypothetical protein
MGNEGLRCVECHEPGRLYAWRYSKTKGRWVRTTVGARCTRCRSCADRVVARYNQADAEARRRARQQGS